MSARSSVRNVLLVILSVVITTVALEAVLRIFKPQVYFGERLNTWDEELGIRHIPGTATHLVRPEFSTEVVINSKGLRDVEHSYDKPSGTRRILCLGDSFTFGFGVERHEAFPSLLEDLLNTDKHADGWEVINAGVCGHGTAHQLAYFETEGYRYAPELILLCICPINDFKNNVDSGLYTVGDEGLTRHRKVLTCRQKARRLTQHVPGYSTIFGNSHLVAFLKHRIILLTHRLNHPEKRDPGEKPAASRKADVLTRRLLLSLRDSCAGQNCSLAAMVVPPLDGSDPPERVTELVKWIKSQGILYVDLGPSFQEARRQGVNTCFAINRHWNKAGHELAAERVHDFLTDKYLSSNRRNM